MAFVTLSGSGSFFMNKFIILSVIFVFLFMPVAFAKQVKTDYSGKPVYNSWERFEKERKNRNRIRNQSSSQPATTTPDSAIKNSAHPTPTPSSVILNRPVQIQAEPGNEDFGF